MRSEQLIVLLTIITTATAVVGLILGVLRKAHEQTAEEKREREQIRVDGYTAGFKSRDDEVSLLRSQRDDARRERDAALRRSDEMESRYLNLRDRGN